MPITREIFDHQWRPRFGTANPEQMHMAFWEWMIRGEDMETPDEGSPLNEHGLIMRKGVLKSTYGPWRARDLFQAPPGEVEGPIWTFERMGRTRTELSDGRVVCVGGEHEDYYDPDFCIYNDVVVLGPDEEIAIYGYPKEVLPPTDFHTASLVGDRIILIGSVGYPEEQRPGHTPVYALHLSDFHIGEVPTTGEMPGWIHDHEADADADGVITIRGGKVLVPRDERQEFRRNIEDHALDTRSNTWTRLTGRNWPQFSIRRRDRELFLLEAHPEKEALYPLGIEHMPDPCDDWRTIRFRVQGVPISVSAQIREIEIVIEGTLVDELLTHIVEAIRSQAEAAIQLPCVAERL